jgi:hypothetical protein
MALLGAGLGPSSMAFLVSAQNAVPWNERGVVTASSQFFRTISGAIGVGALGAVLNARLLSTTSRMQGLHIGASVLLNSERRASLPPTVLIAVRQGLAEGLHRVFVLLALFAVACLVAVVHILRTAEEGITITDPHTEAVVAVE